jgi:hypothetical protein
MPYTQVPALTPDQWDARDYRQSARDLDDWAKSQSGAHEEDSTEYVAKLGLNPSDAVVVMNRAHDRVLIPPPARAPLAAFALAGQPLASPPQMSSCCWALPRGVMTNKLRLPCGISGNESIHLLPPEAA